MKKIDLTDLTFLIPVRIDCQERLENLRFCVVNLYGIYINQLYLLI